MTDITDAEAAEVLWASSDEGKAAVLAACRKADDLGLPGTCGRPPSVIEPADISAIVYAAYLAAGWDAGPAEDDEPVQDVEPARCEHRWRVLKAQAVDPPGFVFGKPVPHTAALARCLDCGLPESWLMVGTWTRDDLTAWTDKSLAGQWEEVPR